MTVPLVVKRIEVVTPGAPRVPMNVPGVGTGAPRVTLPATTPMWDRAADQRQPVMVIGSQVVLRVTVDAPGAPADMGYGLTAWLMTLNKERLALFNGAALSALPFTADVVLQVQITGFVAITEGVTWELTDGRGQLVAKAEAPIELYFVPKAPAGQMPQGLPVELLNSFVTYARVSGWHLQAMQQAAGLPKLLGFTLSMAAAAQPVDAAEQVAMATLYCFNHNPPGYNVAGGGQPGYTRGSNCQLLGWTLALSPAVCSCEDQAAVLWLILTTFFGRDVKQGGISGVSGVSGAYWITAQGLVGSIAHAPLSPGQGPNAPQLVNNPFMQSPHHGYAAALVLSPNAPASLGVRSSFSSHRFCVLADAGNTIADATLGPYCGQISVDDYVRLIVDASYPGNAPWQTVRAQTNLASGFMMAGCTYSCT